MKTHLQLILGGARSGKSRFALHQGNESIFESRIFLATATAQDEEMTRRIARHQAERGREWKTIEEPYDLMKVLESCPDSSNRLIILDCATLWISNLLCGMGGKKMSCEEIEKLFEQFLRALPRLGGQLRVISNEVGMGIVPESKLGREFRDLQGRFNQSVASVADEVVFIVAGIPQKIK